MTASQLAVRILPYTDPVVTRLVEVVQQEYVVRYGAPDVAHVDPAQFAPPAGLFLVGYRSGGQSGSVGPDADEPVATGGWRLLPGPAGSGGPVDVVAEIKRMFVVRSARRQGVGAALLTELERTARDAGVTRMVLNTGLRQPEAIAMYEAAGYTPAPGFGHYADVPGALFYGKLV